MVDFNPREFWRVIYRGPFGDSAPYQSRNAKAKLIRNPTVRYIEKILANMIFARTEDGSTPNDELYCLENK